MNCISIWILLALLITLIIPITLSCLRNKVKKNSIFDKKIHPPMTKWYSLEVLFDAAKRTIISTIFGQYADRRLIQAALDKSEITPNSLVHNNNEIWLDFVADTGDGFESTYTVIYSLAQPSIEVSFKNEVYNLPRGNVLIFGGDEVYPTPSRYNYKYKLTELLKAAFPEQKDMPNRPQAFLLPGNHDWYDGLTLFLALFCGKKELSEFGNWTFPQNRTYFAISLPNNFWIFGIDSQLGEDIDLPQEQYFSKIVERFIGKNNHVILCVASPTWHDVCSKDENKKNGFQRGIEYVAKHIILEKTKDDVNTKVKIHCVLTGDLHHYSRYESQKSKTQFITAGGGGAFLHPTHQLMNNISTINWCGKEDSLEIGHDDTTGNEACYPSKFRSKLLSLNNLLFPFKNKMICLYFGLISLMLIYLLPKNYYYSFNGWYLFIPFIFIFLSYFYHYDEDSKITSSLIAIAHGILQYILGIVLVKYFICPYLSQIEMDFLDSLCLNNTLLHQVFLLSSLVIVSGLIFGFLLGIILYISCCLCDLQITNGFSSFYYSGYKNFLRIKITKDKIEIYPLGIKKPLKRKYWYYTKIPMQSKIKPSRKIEYTLIEKPIIISLRNSKNN